MRGRRKDREGRGMIYLIIAAGIFWLDYICKEYMDSRLSEKEEKPVLGGRIILRKLYNRGIILGFLKERRGLVAGISGILSLALLLGWMKLLTRKGFGFLKLAGSFLVGGGLSNLYDRLVRGHVIDYFSFGVKWKKLRRIVFNLSDIFIFMGASMTLLFGLCRRK